ncbi:hypothetical protein [Paenibacillus sp. GCM10027626]|uniref:hypothetical protein n=1 Tax=Paenibacillus sp. GCM10027626 TaxID=3273411 RepID=UPI00363C1DDB
MEPIYPLHEERIKRFNGMPVCVITKDGQRHIGILSACKDGRVLLNGHSTGPASGPQGKKKNKKKRPAAAAAKNMKTSEKTRIQGHSPYQPYPPHPYNPWGKAIAIDQAQIAFLFLLF